MEKSFFEALDNEIKKAEENYQEAKNQVLSNFKSNELIQEVHMFTEFGAAYATHIDKITRYATEIKTLYQVKNMYEHYQKQIKPENILLKCFQIVAYNDGEKVFTGSAEDFLIDNDNDESVYNMLISTITNGEHEEEFISGNWHIVLNNKTEEIK